MRARRVALISDVHGNAVALAAVLREIEREQPDVVVHCGDLTWGPLPSATADLLDGIGCLCVRGNADRAVDEAFRRLRDGAGTVTPRERWLVEQHDPDLRAWLAALPETLELTVEGVGEVLCCHGSPRSDEELVTVETPEARLSAAVADTEARVVVSGHTHVSFVRETLGRTFMNPGSVGMPYEGAPGAYWALLGPGIEHRRTEYDLDETARGYRKSGDPLAEEMIGVLLDPPTPAEVIAHAESRAFSD